MLSQALVYLIERRPDSGDESWIFLVQDSLIVFEKQPCKKKTWKELCNFFLTFESVDKVLKPLNRNIPSVLFIFQCLQTLVLDFRSVSRP